MCRVGVDSPGRRARVRAVRGEGRRATRTGAGRLQGAGAGPRIQHLCADSQRARDLGTHHRAVPDRAAAAPGRARRIPQRDRRASRLDAAAHAQVTIHARTHTDVYTNANAHTQMYTHFLNF